MHYVFNSQSLLLACSLLFLIIVSPLLTYIPLGSFALTVMFTIILLSSVRLVSEDRDKLVAVGSIVGIALIFLWVGEIASFENFILLGEAIYVGINIYVIFIVLKAIVTSPEVDEEVLIGAVAVYLLLGITWALMYDLIYAINSDAFVDLEGNRENNWNIFVYFSFSTLTTLGYGDITAVSPFARTLSIIQAVTGVIFEAIVIARLVGLYRRSDERTEQNFG